MTPCKENNDPAIEIETGPNPLAAVIWLHGLGADGHDFEPIIPELNLPSTLPLRFIFPHAPFRPVTINGGQVARAWYDMSFSETGILGNKEHLAEAETTVDGLINQEINRGMAADRLILAGFSQGGAVALHSGLRYQSRLAGIMALSTYVPAPEALPETPLNVPVFMAHGANDPLVPLALAKAGHEILVSKGLSVQWHSYPMPHSVCEQEIQDISRWLQHVVSEVE
jgi:phospholipase/carboxylesterase